MLIIALCNMRITVNNKRCDRNGLNGMTRCKALNSPDCYVIRTFPALLKQHSSRRDLKSDGGVDGDSSFLECCSVSTGKWLPTFWTSVMRPKHR